MLQSILILIWPSLAIRLGKTKLPDVFSPIVLSYLFGIALRNSHALPLDNKISENWMGGSMLMAIPILLYTTDIQRCIRYAGRSMLAFGLCVLGGLLGTSLATLIYPLQEIPSWMLSGMLMGMYTGGTPNMQAIGMALSVPADAVVLVNAADIVCGGLWLLVLTSVAHKLLKGILPDFSEPPGSPVIQETAPVAAVPIIDRVKAILLTVVVVAASLGLCFGVYGNLEHTAFIMLILTSLGIALAFLPAVKKWAGIYETGEYFLLMFCVALGMQADFRDIIGKGAGILLFTAIAMPLSIAIHLVLSRLFRIDRDTFLISSTAGIYGPAFIGQVASAIHNRHMIFPGIALGLLGYAIGNYLGIGLAYALKWAIF